MRGEQDVDRFWSKPQFHCRGHEKKTWIKHAEDGGTLCSSRHAEWIRNIPRIPNRIQERHRLILHQGVWC